MSKPTIYIVKDGDGKVISKGTLKETAIFFKKSTAAIYNFGQKKTMNKGAFKGLTCELIIPESDTEKIEPDKNTVVQIREVKELKFESEAVPGVTYIVGKATKTLNMRKRGKEINIRLKYLKDWIKELRDMYEAYGDL